MPDNRGKSPIFGMAVTDDLSLLFLYSDIFIIANSNGIRGKRRLPPFYNIIRQIDASRQERKKYSGRQELWERRRLSHRSRLLVS